MSTGRPLDPGNPYYTWLDHEGTLMIFSECCADGFSPEEEIVLRDYLLAKHPITSENPTPTALAASPTTEGAS